MGCICQSQSLSRMEIQEISEESELYIGTEHKQNLNCQESQQFSQSTKPITMQNTIQNDLLFGGHQFISLSNFDSNLDSQQISIQKSQLSNFQTFQAIPINKQLLQNLKKEKNDYKFTEQSEKSKPN